MKRAERSSQTTARSQAEKGILLNEKKMPPDGRFFFGLIRSVGIISSTIPL
ncbi:hypothetical protein PO124_15440 [Bacillus licheniformis]|nr:hypothetical protein [Bacillus licheniformis]